jgi:hypothetical protein
VENKFKVKNPAGKIVASLFWDSKGNLAVEFMKRGV